MNRGNRTHLLAKKTTNLNFAPTIVKCSTLLECQPLRNPISTSGFVKCSDIPLDQSAIPEEHSANPRMVHNESIAEEKADEEAEVRTQSLGMRLRKNIYRSRKEKKSILSKPKFKTKSKLFEDNRLHLHYRNQLMSLISLLGRREYLFNILKGRKIGVELIPLKLQEIEERLEKELSGRGKDKARKNFNHLTN